MPELHQTSGALALPPIRVPTTASGGEYLASRASDYGDGDEIVFQPQTINPKSRTVDVVWYGGATVPRTDPETGDPYMLRLDMAGCRIERLNSGAPVFDSHMSGLDMRSMFAGQMGTRAQRGSVVKAWADGPRGMATLQFGVEGENEDTDRLWSGISSGRIRNLSFGTTIMSKMPERDAAGNGRTMPHPSGQQAQVFVATDWEPFEISAITVPADFSTQFLGAQIGGTSTSVTVTTAAAPQPVAIAVPGAASLSVQGTGIERATSPKETQVMEQTVQTGTEARPTQALLDAERAEGARLERDRVSQITQMGVSFSLPALANQLISQGTSVEDARARFLTGQEIRAVGRSATNLGIATEFTENLVASGVSTQEARSRLLDEAVRVSRERFGAQLPDHRGELVITRDAADTQGKQMMSALLLRHDRRFYLNRTAGGQFFEGCGEQQQREAEDMGRNYIGYSLLDMGREWLQSRGVNTRGMDKLRLAEMILRSNRMHSNFELFEGGAESTSDFPAILANVANKTLRQQYQSYPQTFKPFCRQVTAADFKPVNRVLLADAPVLMQLNEKGEYHRGQLLDNNVSYTLATFGEIVALTRKTIINDDLQAFTRVPGLLGVAAARLQSDKVWAVITGNPSAIYAGDTTATNLFAVGHGNLYTGAGSNLSSAGVAALGEGRTGFRLQKGPNGTILNLIPRYIAVPAALETVAQQTIYPMNLAVTAVTAGVPEWIRSLTPIVEPRLDANSTTAWYLIADPTDIDTIEYCFLEGQEGVYFETRQGFEVDGIEMKARMDFAAAAIEYRGLQKNAGA